MAGVVWAFAVPSASFAGPVIFSSAGSTPADIQGTVDAFRNTLGMLNPNVAMSFSSGRRELNWDGVPDVFAAPNSLPGNFFNVTAPAGVVLSTPGTGLQVSAAPGNPTNTPVRFGNLDPSYPNRFTTFSGSQLFTSLGSPATFVDFLAPATTTHSFVNGFGAVFTNAQLKDFTQILYFDPSNKLLGSFSVPVGPAGGLSFLGVYFNQGEQVGEVLLLSGSSALGSGVVDDLAHNVNVVAMDDFIYGEPGGAPVPEPASLRLVVLAGVAGAMIYCRRLLRSRFSTGG
jgi:hypothetical protein